jgi:hypothetical protein
MRTAAAAGKGLVSQYILSLAFEGRKQIKVAVAIIRFDGLLFLCKTRVVSHKKGKGRKKGQVQSRACQTRWFTIIYMYISETESTNPNLNSRPKVTGGQSDRPGYKMTGDKAEKPRPEKRPKSSKIAHLQKTPSAWIGLVFDRLCGICRLSFFIIYFLCQLLLSHTRTPTDWLYVHSTVQEPLKPWTNVSCRFFTILLPIKNVLSVSAYCWWRMVTMHDTTKFSSIWYTTSKSRFF